VTTYTIPTAAKCNLYLSLVKYVVSIKNPSYVPVFEYSGAVTLRQFYSDRIIGVSGHVTGTDIRAKGHRLLRPFVSDSSALGGMIDAICRAYGVLILLFNVKL
jgi:hypothetical protein